MWIPDLHLKRELFLNWRTVTLVLTTPVLLFGLQWLAVHFPLQESQVWQSAEWESETVVRIQHSFYEGRHYRWPSQVRREYRLNCGSGAMEWTATEFDRGGLTGGANGLFKEIPNSDFTVARLPREELGYFVQQLDLKPPRGLPRGIDLVVLFDPLKRETSRWRIREGEEIMTADGMVVTRGLDGATFIVRNAETGVMQSSIPVQNANWAPSVQESVLYFGERQGAQRRRAAYELQTGRELPISGAWQGLIYDVWRDECLNVASKDYALSHNWPPVLENRSITSNEVLSQINFPAKLGLSTHPSGAVRYSADGKQVVFVAQNDVVYFIDKQSGQITRIVDPRRRHGWIMTFIGLGAACWCVLLNRVCRDSKYGRRLQRILLWGLLVSFLIMRLRWSGHHGNHERLAGQILRAIPVVWGLGLALHSAAKNHSLWQRLRMPVVYVLVVYLLAMSLCNSAYQQSLVLRSTISYIVLISPLAIFFARNRAMHESENSPRRFSLATLFELIAIASLFATAVVQTEPRVAYFMTVSRILDSLVGCACIVGVILVVRVSNRQGAVFRALGALLVVSVAGGVSFAGALYTGHGLVDMYDFKRVLGPIVAASLLAAFAFWSSDARSGIRRNSSHA